MNIKAEAGKSILIEHRDNYRLSLLQQADDSPVIVLNSVDVVDGHEEISPITELDMNGIFEQVFNVLADK